MATINQDWYAANEGRVYPLHDAAGGDAVGGGRLPTDLLVDAKIHFPDSLGRHAVLAAVSVSPGVVTVTFEAVDDVDSPTAFSPLAVVSAVRPVPIGVHVAVSPQASGVGGWVVFGSGVNTRVGYSARVTGPAAGRLSPRAARAYRKLPVSGIGSFGLPGGGMLSGMVTLRAEAPMYLRAEDRVINGRSREVIVVGLAVKASDRFTGDSDTPTTLEAFAGACGRRPESRNCGDPEPIEYVNGVGPDCGGTLTLQFVGCASASRIVESCGVAVECQVGLGSACPPGRLPTDDGSLPDESPQASGVSYSDSCN